MSLKGTCSYINFHYSYSSGQKNELNSQITIQSEYYPHYWQEPVLTCANILHLTVYPCHSPAFTTKNSFYMYKSHIECLE